DRGFSIIGVITRQLRRCREPKKKTRTLWLYEVHRSACLREAAEDEPPEQKTGSLLGVGIHAVKFVSRCRDVRISIRNVQFRLPFITKRIQFGCKNPKVLQMLKIYLRQA